MSEAKGTFSDFSKTSILDVRLVIGTEKKESIFELIENDIVMNRRAKFCA